MKILITGSDGQLGYELRRSLLIIGNVVPINRERCDLTDETKFRALLDEVDPDVIVNAAAYTSVDGAETEQHLAYSINSDVVKVLAEEATKRNILLIHFSTDYVFDGEKSEAYKENDLPIPINIYGKSKLIGETLVSSLAQNHIIFRLSWVFGVHGNNFIKTILQQATLRDSLQIVNDQFGAPTCARNIAEVTAHTLKRYGSLKFDGKAQELFHLSAAGRTTWYEVAKLVIDEASKTGNYLGTPLKMNSERIKAVSSKEFGAKAKRPKNSTLDSSKLFSELSLEAPDWKLGVKHLLEQLL